MVPASAVWFFSRDVLCGVSFATARRLRTQRKKSFFPPKNALIAEIVQTLVLKEL
jgi:hypothetical protein